MVPLVVVKGVGMYQYKNYLVVRLSSFSPGNTIEFMSALVFFFFFFFFFLT